MRILHLIADLPPTSGGPTWSLVGLADAQVALGHDVEVVCASSGAELVAPRRARLHVAPRRGPKRLAFSPGAIDVARRLSRDADVVHAHGLWMQPAWLGSVLPTRGVRIMTPRGMLLPDALAAGSSYKSAYLQLIEQYSLRRYDWIHVTSEEERDAVSSVLPRARYVVAPNGVEVPDAISVPSSPPRRLGFLGRLHPNKRLELLLDALPHLPGEELLVAGGGEARYESSLRARAETLGVSSRVRWLGWIDGLERTRFFEDIAALVLCSVSTENFGRVVAEAFAHARPAIVTRNLPWQSSAYGGVVHLVGESGRDIAHAATAMLGDERTWRHSARDARAIAEERFGWERCASALIEGVTGCRNFDRPASRTRERAL